jgi:hypothetical protein
VAVDDRKRIFVSDSYMGVIKVYFPDGDLDGLIGDPGGDPRRFTTPTNMVIRDQARLYVVETRASRISVLRLQE